MHTPDEWSRTISDVGSMSSPVAVDLNNDGVKDIVLGAGGKEFAHTEKGVIALDGSTGEILWTHPARNQIVGTAVTQDITEDGIPDIFMGGRSAILLALDGKSGKKIWEYLPDDDSTDYYRDTTILNFYSVQLIPDVDGDEVSDILATYGGYIKAEPDELDRPSGALMILNGQSGKVLAKALVPDKKESYCSPVVYDFENDGKLEVIFGTGGEQINGGLYRADLEDVLQEDLSNAITLADGGGKGFIAPPLLVDVNLDGTKDIATNTVNGRLMVIDGSTNDLIWQTQLEGSFDTYNMPAPGFFVGDDQVPDFFTSVGKGPWPNTEYTVHLLVDGSTGEIVFQDTLGTFQYASPVVTDMTDNGASDVVLAINTKVKSEMNNSNMQFLGTDLLFYPNGQGEPRFINPTRLGTNLGTTPLITDLDDDGYMDIIQAYMGDPVQFYSFKNLVIERKELKRKTDMPRWGRYMGTDGKSVFE